MAFAADERNRHASLRPELSSDIGPIVVIDVDGAHQVIHIGTLIQLRIRENPISTALVAHSCPPIDSWFEPGSAGAPGNARVTTPTDAAKHVWATPSRRIQDHPSEERWSLEI